MISERLASLLMRELELDSFDFANETKAFEVPGWDSLRHVALLTAIENEYGIRLGGLEVMRLKNIGDLDALVARKSSRT
jgi:acyl carrier protein